MYEVELRVPGDQELKGVKAVEAWGVVAGDLTDEFQNKGEGVEAALCWVGVNVGPVVRVIVYIVRASGLEVTGVVAVLRDRVIVGGGNRNTIAHCVVVVIVSGNAASCVVLGRVRGGRCRTAG